MKEATGSCRINAIEVLSAEITHIPNINKATLSGTFYLLAKSQQRPSESLSELGEPPDVPLSLPAYGPIKVIRGWSEKTTELLKSLLQAMEEDVAGSIFESFEGSPTKPAEGLVGELQSQARRTL